MFSQHTHAHSTTAEQCGRRCRRRRIGSDRWSGNGGRGGPVTAGSPEDRTEEVAKAHGSGWTGWAGRFEGARRGAGPDPRGPGVRSRRAAERAEEFVTKCVCVVQGSVHSGQHTQGSSRSDRRWRGRRHQRRVDVVTIARTQWARRRARSFNEAAANRGALSPPVQPFKEFKGRRRKGVGKGKVVV